jgi:hypothetical protein
MVRARSSDRPELIIVANWRENTARSLSLTRPVPGSLTSVLRPAPFSVSIEIGAYPSWRSRVTTAASLSASIDPAAILPSRSRTL